MDTQFPFLEDALNVEVVHDKRYILSQMSFVESRKAIAEDTCIIKCVSFDFLDSKFAFIF